MYVCACFQKIEQNDSICFGIYFVECFSIKRFQCLKAFFFILFIDSRPPYKKQTNGYKLSFFFPSFNYISLRNINIFQPEFYYRYLYISKNKEFFFHNKPKK